MALVALEGHPSSEIKLSPGTHSILPIERLRAMLGRQRGNSAHGILREVAEFLTHRQQAGVPMEQLQAQFHGFTLGPASVARGYDLDQLVNAAVRSVSAFGQATDLVNDEEAREAPRHTVRTAEFLKTLKREVAGDDADIKSRFEMTLKPSQELPELTVDYAFRRWMVQITSLPATPRQAVHALRESQSKLYEIDVIRKNMEGNMIMPVLLINEDVLYNLPTTSAEDEARTMLDRLTLLAKSSGLEILQSASAFEAADLVAALK
ncbi:hypothetical protein [Variovorax sp. ZT4R33]|uniref:hypothetical protein n=1 Tax=Variovorax sp. ZT4R33 TaxID=3443743 RepID=UPI003F45E879